MAKITRNIIWALLAISFFAGSIWIHYQVKVEMPRGGSVGAGLFQAGDAVAGFFRHRSSRTTGGVVGIPASQGGGAGILGDLVQPLPHGYAGVAGNTR